MAYAQQIISFSLKGSELNKHEVDGTDKGVMMNRKSLSNLFLILTFIV